MFGDIFRNLVNKEVGTSWVTNKPVKRSSSTERQDQIVDVQASLYCQPRDFQVLCTRLI